MNTSERLLGAAAEIWKEYIRQLCRRKCCAAGKIDRLTEKYTEQQLQHLADIFVVCSRYELAFWEMSWNLSR